MIQVARIIGTGLATAGLIAAGVGTGVYYIFNINILEFLGGICFTFEFWKDLFVNVKDIELSEIVAKINSLSMMDLPGDGGTGLPTPSESGADSPLGEGEGEESNRGSDADDSGSNQSQDKHELGQDFDNKTDSWLEEHRQGCINTINYYDHGADTTEADKAEMEVYQAELDDTETEISRRRGGGQ